MKIRKGLVLCWVALLGQGAAAELTDGLYAAFDTTMGNFTCRLDYAEAPLTCANFAGLAEGSQHWIDPEAGSIRNDPFYDGLIFHRVMDGFMIQGGCPLGTGTSGPGYAIPDEITALTHHSAGILSMANSGPDSGGSQFFITLDPTPWLDGDHAVFGEVVDGMDVVYDIGLVEIIPTNRPLVDVVMNSVEILRVGAAAEAFDHPLPEVSPHSLSITSGVPIKVVAAEITNQCEIRLFNSTNLIDWAGLDATYFHEGAESWMQSASINRPAEYFKATQIYYPQAVAVFSDIEGHTLTFTQGTNSIVFNPEADGIGTCNIVGNPDSVTYWAEWTSEPYTGRVSFKPSLYSQLQFLIGPRGKCTGRQHVGYWREIGEWIFTDTPPAE